MIIVGVTGNTGSGKSTVANFLSRRGAKVIDADKITHRLLNLNTTVGKKILKGFGNDVLASTGLIDRKKLAKICFSNFRNWRLLCKIVHPEVLKIIKKEIKKARRQGLEFLVIDAPLLIESGLDKLVNYVILTKANLKQACQRAHLKLGLSEEEFKRRVKFQLSFQEKFPKSDFVVDNTKTLNFTERQVDEIWKRIISNQSK
ncbi:MAG: dephospho-CoA kinase [Candidatus Omnitrophica bacterium]|nr:dephospho-CoA kinase [Candidatus Omnitrophota bacterium]